MNVKSKNIASSSWIDPDDAPELTADDFSKALWFKGDMPINAQIGKAFFRKMLADSSSDAVKYELIDLPDELIAEAMQLTHTKTTSQLIILALQELIRKNKVAEMNDTLIIKTNKNEFVVLEHQ